MRSSQCRGPSKRIRKRKTERRNAVREREEEKGRWILNQ
jgi:hypothetical protein